MTTRPFAHDQQGTPARAWRAHPRWSEVEPVELSGVDRVVVVAAHPDDESLGAGGLLASAVHAELATMVVHVTDGEASHPHSPTTSPDELARRRRAEASAAAAALGVQDVHRVGAPDGQVAAHEEALVRLLVDLLRDARRTVLAAPWRGDGHPDHEAVGRACAIAARRTGAQLWEFPVWFWHWGVPEDTPLERFHAFELAAEDRRAKSVAVATHVSQVQALSAQPGDEVLLSSELLEHFSSERELFLISGPQTLVDTTLDELHAKEGEPWGADSRWYEWRKRALVLAMLPSSRFSDAVEVGCSTGVLAEALAERCDRLLAIDSSPTALALAHRRLLPWPGAAVSHADLPEEWPANRRFDLVVVAEVGYFLSPAALDRMVQQVAVSLTPDGVVVLCHWRHPVEGWVMDAEEVHRRFEAETLPPTQATYRDPDVEIRVLARTAEWPDPRR